MRRIQFNLVCTMIVVLCLLGMGASMAAADEPITQQSSRVELSDMQKKEIANLHKEIISKKAQLISKYVEYGVITEEKGKKIMKHMAERYQKLDQNGFIPNWDKKHHHMGNEHNH